MLRELNIRNYAIIESLGIEFHPGLNTITGETGAGKSILLGALGLLSGDRADSSVISGDAQNCVIEARFEIQGLGLEPLLEHLDIDPCQELIIRRIIAPTSRSRAFVNDLPVNLTTLKELSERLIDIHSQHQTLLLAQTDFQTRILDAVAEIQLADYQAVYRKLKSSERELLALEKQAVEAIRRREYLEYQIEQIVVANITVDDTHDLEIEQKTLSHATEIAAALDLTATAMQNDEHGVVFTLKNSMQAIARIKANYPQAESYFERINSLYLEARDLTGEIENALERVDINPARLTQVEERLDLIYSLCHKHAVDDVTELLEISSKMQQELDQIEGTTQKIELLTKQIEQLTIQVQQLSQQISLKRQATTAKIEKHVVETLRELGIVSAAFSIELTPCPATITGTDSVRFLFSANQGQELQAIEQVASGGEMSRLMLALKWLVSKSIQLPTIIFDEIDTGVSGAVAHKMGQIIQAMGLNMQVLNITHLPQVASKGQYHYLVYKQVGGTRIRLLTAEERIDHIATMLSGAQVTPAARNQAIELLKN